jgi:hypothetical protein
MIGVNDIAHPDMPGLADLGIGKHINFSKPIL